MSKQTAHRIQPPKLVRPTVVSTSKVPTPPSKDGSGPQPTTCPALPPKVSSDGSGPRLKNASLPSPQSIFQLAKMAIVDDQDFLGLGTKETPPPPSGLKKTAAPKPPVNYQRLLASAEPEVRRIANLVKDSFQEGLDEASRLLSALRDRFMDEYRDQHKLVIARFKKAFADAEKAYSRVRKLRDDLTPLVKRGLRVNKEGLVLEKRLRAAELTLAHILNEIKEREASAIAKEVVLEARMKKAEALKNDLDEFMKTVVRVRVQKASAMLFNAVSIFMVILTIFGLIVGGAAYATGFVSISWKGIGPAMASASSREPTEEVRKMIANTTTALTSKVIGTD